MDVDEDAEVELEDIATATFGNNKGSDFAPQLYRTKPPHQELPVIRKNKQKLRFKIT